MSLLQQLNQLNRLIDKMKNYVFVRMKSFEKLSNYYNAIFDKNLDHFDFIEKIREKYDREELAILQADPISRSKEKSIQCSKQRIYCPCNSDNS